MRMLAIMASLAVLAACAQGPKQVQSTAPTVTYSYNGEAELTEARSKAVDYCREYGRSARLLSTAASGGGGTATFDCV